MNKTTQEDDSDHLFNIPRLSSEQINLIAVISSLISFIIVLVLYKCIKHLKRRRSLNQQSTFKKNQPSKKFKNIVLVNQNLSKPDLKPINQQFQINTAYSNQTNFNKLFPYYNVYSQNSNLPGNLSQQAFYYSDLENGDQKNPSFNVENNLYLSKKFIQLKNESKEKSSSEHTSGGDQDTVTTNDSLTNYSLGKRSVNQVSTDSSDHRSEDSDTEGLTRKSQRLAVARPVSIKFNLIYSTKDKSLYIEILSVDNLVFNSKHCYYYVKMNLRDHTRDHRFKSQKTKITKGSTSVFFNQTVTGKKMVSTYKTGTLGFLKLELQLTNEKGEHHRIKVTVKNTQNLPLKYDSSFNLNKSNTTFMGHPEFYLILNLFYGQEKLDVKETSSSFSSCPNWDQQIVFNVNEYSAFDEKFILDQNSSANRAELSARLFKSKLKHLSLQITVVKGNFYSKHAAIGQVKIGDKGSIDGILHWNEMCNSNKAICKWHEIRSLS